MNPKDKNAFQEALVSILYNIFLMKPIETI